MGIIYIGWSRYLLSFVNFQLTQHGSIIQIIIMNNNS